MVKEMVVSVAFPPAMLTVFVEPCWLTNPVSAAPSLLSAKVQGALGTEFAIHRPDTPVCARIASGTTGRVAAPAVAAPSIAVNCLAPFTPRIPLSPGLPPSDSTVRVNAIFSPPLIPWNATTFAPCWTLKSTALPSTLPSEMGYGPVTLVVVPVAASELD